MEHRLKTFYARWAAAIVVLWAAGRIARHLTDGALPSPSGPLPWGPLVFILAAVCGLAGPILYRSYFAFVCRNRSRIDPDVFMRFERHLILIGMASLALAMGTDMLAAPLFYRAGSLLTALYAVYSTFPSRNRLALDRRLFRVAAGAVKAPPLRVIHNSAEGR
jgi:hypothetical protein